jgi:manganese transport protein
MQVPSLEKTLCTKRHHPGLGALEWIRFIGPGLLVTVGFIDPGNWASNLAAGSQFGYVLLWMVTLSMIMLILLQHNVAHLGIATGLCLSEAATRYLPKKISHSAHCFLFLALLSSFCLSAARSGVLSIPRYFSASSYP